MASVPLIAYVILALTLFGIGLIGVITRRNMLIALMSMELMLNAANILFIAFARHHGDLQGHVIVFFVMALAAAEAAIGLALAIAFFRHRRSVKLDEAAEMKY